MSQEQVFALAIGIGFVAGLRSMTAPAAVSWGTHLGRLNLSASTFAFMGTAAAVGIFSILAAAEYVVDLLPRTPNRTEPASLLVRVVTGGLAGACVCVPEGGFVMLGGMLGAVSGVIGAYAGFEARTRLVKKLNVPAAAIAIGEDLVAIGLAYAILFV